MASLVDKFEQYFDTFHLITMNDLHNFCNYSKGVHPFENNKLKISMISEFTNMVYGKNTKMLQINEKLCQAKIAHC